MNIQLMDVQREFENHGKEYEEAILSVARSGFYIGGTEVENFEEEFAVYVGAKYAVSCGNGTNALVIAMRALEIGEGDEVITVAFTFFATGESIAAVGACPVFVDVDKNSYCIDTNLIEEKITSKTKAILPVHLYGNCANMQEIKRIAQKYNLKIIADCAQAIGTKYNGDTSGILGDISCFSFFPTKNLGGGIGDGGMIVTNNEEIADICKALRAHGSGKGGDFLFRKKGGVLSGNNEKINLNRFDKYHNYLIGYNSRLDSIQAAFLRRKLKYIEEFISERRAVAKYYNSNLLNSNYVIPKETEGSRHSYYLYILQHKNSEYIMSVLGKKGIESRTYYPIPLHLQVAFRYLKCKEGMLPKTEHLCNTTFAIPIYPQIKDKERKYIVDTLIDID